MVITKMAKDVVYVKNIKDINFLFQTAEDEFTEKWQVPEYIYPENSFPNAVSGSGYLITRDVIECIYAAGLRTPFLNLEDVFITGLAASQCEVHLKNSQWFNFLGKEVGQVKKQDILVHGLKTQEQIMQVHQRVQKMYY